MWANAQPDSRPHGGLRRTDRGNVFVGQLDPENAQVWYGRRSLDVN